jgi:methionyl-tRNA synthetase
MDDLKVTDGFTDVIELLNKANKYIEDSAPWALAKDETKKEELECVMSHLAYVIFVGSMLLSPALTHKSDEAMDDLGLAKEKRDYNNIHDSSILNGLTVKKGELLFPRLDVAKEAEYIASLMKK